MIRPALHLSQTLVADRVLLVDGDPGGPAPESDSGGVIRLLADQGCAVTVVRDGREALKASGGGRFLFILLRASHPGGLAIMWALRERVPAARVVIATPNPTLESAVKALRLGAFDYLGEPVCPAAVEALVCRARLEGDPGQRQLLLSLQILTPGLVHELRNPLSGILGSSQMLASQVAADPPAREYVEIVREEARLLEGFLSRLAEFARLPVAGLADTREVDLHGLLKRMLIEAAPACTARRIRQATRFDPRIFRVRAHPVRLSQACSEILRNALEAMPSGGTLTVTTRQVNWSNSQLVDSSKPVDQLTTRPVDDSTGWVEIEFADTGTGMTDEVRRRAFEPFFSTRPRALGIGLPLAQAILFSHGGMIGLDSRSGAGTDVRLALPVAPAQGNDLSAAAQAGQVPMENR